MIRDNVRLQARLIDDLLDLARIAGQAGIPLRDRRRPRPDPPGRGDLYGREQRQGPPPHAGPEGRQTPSNGLPARLQQVIWNSITNAVLYTPKGGRIAIRTRSDVGGDLVAEISDEGLGIDPDHLPHIFDAFRRGEGAGDIALRWVGAGPDDRPVHRGGPRRDADGDQQGRRHGGHITLQFATVMPQRIPRSKSRPRPPGGGPLRILLAEENHAMVQTTADVLRRKATRSPSPRA